MKQVKFKKTWLKVIFVVVLLAIIAYTFRNQAGDILAELEHTPLHIILAILVSSVIYLLIESWITYSLAIRYNPEFKFRQAVYNAFMVCFYRLSTLGSGNGVAAVYNLGQHGIEYSEAIGMYMVQYVMHKISIAIFSGIFLLVNWHFMWTNFRDYGILLIAAYGLTVLICIGLILFVVSKWFHGVILNIGQKFNKNGKLDGALMKLETNAQIMEVSTTRLIKDKKLLIVMILKNLIKFVFWYGIPFLIVFGDGDLSLVNSLSITSLAVMTAAVIPTPAGIGAVEFVMTGLFSVVVGVNRAGAITILYRIATFIFPFAAGGVAILLHRFFARKRGKKHQKMKVGKYE